MIGRNTARHNEPHRAFVARCKVLQGALCFDGETFRYGGLEGRAQVRASLIIERGLFDDTCCRCLEARKAEIEARPV